MSISVLRTADAWWVITPQGSAARVDTTATTTAELLSERPALRAAQNTVETTTPVDQLSLVSPVTAPCRVVAQMTNYVSHVKDSGMDPKTVPLTFFRKASGSISGPYDDIIRPAHVTLLDYEVEIGLVIGEPLTVGDEITAEALKRHVAALVITNDVSARDVQLPKTQFFEAKSYPTFAPVGPVLLVLEDDEIERFEELTLQLDVNGEGRQDSTVADMIFKPLQALQTLSRFQRLEAGDLVLTGTPGGTALKAPSKIVELIGSLLPPAVKWKVFFKKQAENPKYLQDGDVLTLRIGTPDKTLDLGEQKTTVRYAR